MENYHYKKRKNRVMRLLYLAVLFFGIHAGVFAQSGKITLQVKDIPIRQFFDKIEEQSEYRFTYRDMSIDNERHITYSTSGETIETLLQKTLTPLGLQFQISKKDILITRKTDARQENKNSAFAGTVADASGEPIIGASVAVKGSQTGTVSDVDGRFSIQAPAGSTLAISYIGYAPQEIKLGENTNLQIVLQEDQRQLSEVVVVGYGTQKKINLTGSVEVINGDRLQNRPAANVSQALQGTVSGVNFNYGNMGAEPGAKLSLQIRGQGSPYVLIDGTVGDLNMLDPNDVENISVLKDAAASAIYGARAPYGVILITTKSGKTEGKIKVDFSANTAYSTPLRLPKMVDSYTFVRAMNEMHDNQGVARLFTEETVDRIIAYQNNPSLPETVPDPSNPAQWATYLLSNANNDWIDIHFGNGKRDQESLSVRGGNNNIAFFLSAGHAHEKGIFNFGKDTYDRLTFNSKLDFNLTKWWKFTSNTKAAQTERNYPNWDNDGAYNVIIHHIFRTHPQQYFKSPNGYYSLLSRVPGIESSSVASISRRLVQYFATEITPVKNWKINADYSVDFLYSSSFTKSLTGYVDMVDGSLTPIETTVPSSVEKSKSHTLYQSFNVYSNYQISLAEKHNFEIMAGFQRESSMYDYLYGLKKNIITSEVPSISTSTGDMQSDDDLSHWSTQGVFARINYNFMNKYLFEANARYDGASKFARGNRWGAFPSFSLGWNVAREDFWEAVSKYVNAFKIRTSWGRLGNQNVSAYQDLPLLGINTNLNWIIDSKSPAYTTAPNLVNKYLTWESSETIDFGIDLGIFNNRLQINADYYNRRTFNRLGPSQALPAVLGATVPQSNNSELTTKGWDLSLTWKDQINNDFSYYVTAMIFDYINTVTRYNNPTGILTTDYEGKKVGEIWGYETIGLIQTQEEADRINQDKSQSFIHSGTWQTGDVMYKDRDGDGKVNNGKNTVNDHGDLSVIGNSTPRYQFGLTLAAEYKNFDFSVFFQGTAKRDLWLDGNVFWGFNAWNQSSLFTHHMDYYRDKDSETYSGLGVNTDSYYPRPYSQNAQYNKNKQVQTRYLQNGAYARLKNLQLGYSLPSSMLQKIKLTRARLFLSGENILTLTMLPHGFDPETANLGDYGNGKNIFTQAVYSIGLNVSF
ncbi:MAG: TonB-dependent receptor [Dysgonamonadaceae bacterium]|jgi:TonB-linked SusC/RagA family outer membrane protein|nr:TonB-dependent receptor [Dysgonamonadaceae bacterium]